MTTKFRIVDTSELEVAFAWHRGFAGANDAIFPRDFQTFRRLVAERSVWCAEPKGQNTYEAISYANLDEKKNHWEVGGLMVAQQARKKGLGGIMMRMPLAALLFAEDPLSWDRAPSLVTHVLASNPAPRKIIADLGFTFDHKVEIPAHILPGLKADDDGLIRGDEFHLEIPKALHLLEEWLRNWNGKLRDGSDATIDLLDGVTMITLADAIREMANRG